MRKNGAEIIDGKEISVSGTGSWKCLTIVDTATGEILIEKKFHKANFDEIMSNPEYDKYIDNLLEAVMVKNLNSAKLDIDSDSYEEMRSLSIEIEDEFLVEP